MPTGGSVCRAGRRVDPIVAADITGHSLATWQSKDFGKQYRDEAREKLLAAGFGSIR